MIVELLSESGDTIGKYQSPGIPRRDEWITYAGEQYVVENVSWVVERDHNQNVERVRIEVRPVDS